MFESLTRIFSSSRDTSYGLSMTIGPTGDGNIHLLRIELNQVVELDLHRWSGFVAMLGVDVTTAISSLLLQLDVESPSNPQIVPRSGI